MLIRSQNKLDLMQLDDMSICKKGDFPDIHSEFAVVCYKYNAHCVLGEYSTKEKAIKVLDMIQDAYKDFRGGNVYEHSVFQMPQDSEVTP